MKQTLMIFWLLLFATLCIAQDNKPKKSLPDLSGTRILDKIKTKPESVPVIKTVAEDVTMVIEQNESEIKIIRTSKSADGKERVEKILYFTDGRRVGVQGKNDKDNYQTVEWKGKKLVKKVKFVVGSGEGLDWFLNKNGKDSLNMENEEECELSKDGMTLTRKISGGTPPGLPSPPPLKFVFRRQT